MQQIVVRASRPDGRSSFRAVFVKVLLVMGFAGSRCCCVVEKVG